ncbi:MAG: lipoyl synthase [Gammaproteobacteria bacterium]|nr:MAG: lipoyl synthase [Gammaproteobacteria bacterium]
MNNQSTSSNSNKVRRPNKVIRGEKLKGAKKVARIPIKVLQPAERLRKPSWIRARSPFHPNVKKLKSVLREQKLFTVCEEAACPNLGECFGKGTATFMIMGEICTRRCPFCDVGHGRPNPLDEDEPRHLSETIRAMALSYVVITSVDRDDLRDGGAAHFVECIEKTRELNPKIEIEILVPDFRGRMDLALDIMQQAPPDVFNHNLETIPRLYKQCRPGSDYQWSLDLLKRFKQMHRDVQTKSGLMLGLGEEIDEVIEVMKDMRTHNVEMLTLGQYLQPGKHHLPVERYVSPEEFDELYSIGMELGFNHVASGPMVRSSYHADLQAHGEFGKN